MKYKTLIRIDKENVHLDNMLNLQDWKRIATFQRNLRAINFPEASFI